MRYDTDHGPVWVVCISVSNPKAVKDWSWYGIQPTFCVPEEQQVAYLEHEAGRTIVQTSGRPQARNAALRDAWTCGLPCLLLDDDPSGAPFRVVGWPPQRLNYHAVASELLRLLHAHDLYCAATNRTTNPVHISRETRLRARISGGCMLIRPCDLWFDEELIEYEDLDYGLQHLHTYGGVIRTESICTPMRQHNRQDHGRQHDHDYMLKKWGDKVKPTPRSYNPYMLDHADAGKKVKL